MQFMIKESDYVLSFHKFNNFSPSENYLATIQNIYPWIRTFSMILY